MNDFIFPNSSYLLVSGLLPAELKVLETELASLQIRLREFDTEDDFAGFLEKIVHLKGVFLGRSCLSDENEQRVLRKGAVVYCRGKDACNCPVLPEKVGKAEAEGLCRQLDEKGIPSELPDLLLQATTGIAAQFFSSAEMSFVVDRNYSQEKDLLILMDSLLPPWVGNCQLDVSSELLVKSYPDSRDWDAELLADCFMEFVNQVLGEINRSLVERGLSPLLSLPSAFLGDEITNIVAMGPHIPRARVRSSCGSIQISLGYIHEEGLGGSIFS